MSLYAIADLHLSLSPEVDKPMDIYGPRWYNHVERLKENWCASIKDEDTVIVAGDISWGLKLKEAQDDLEWVDRLPGHKVFFKGNHDLWWSGITKLNKMYENITFVQNDFYMAEGFVICGSRGWLTPDNDDFSENDEKIYKRELLRLRNSLAKAQSYLKKEFQNKGAANVSTFQGADLTAERTEILGILHFPPVSKPSAFSGFQQIFEEFGVKRVFYGHIHGEDGFKNAIMGKHHGIDYRLISLDYLNCKPMMIAK